MTNRKAKSPGLAERLEGYRREGLLQEISWSDIEAAQQETYDAAWRVIAALDTDHAMTIYEAVRDIEPEVLIAVVEITRHRLHAAMLPDALRGRKFTPKGGGKGKMRKVIERHWSKIHNTQAAEAWDYLSGLPAGKRSNIDFGYESAEIPGERRCGFRRFSNLLSEVRRERLPA